MNILVGFARKLRIKQTDVERLLWRYLRSKRMANLKFRRQEPIGKYIVDFVCFEKKIVIELDGSQHIESNNSEKDRERDKWLSNEGFLVLRFWDNDIFKNLEGVLEAIREKCLI